MAQAMYQEAIQLDTLMAWVYRTQLRGSISPQRSLPLTHLVDCCYTNSQPFRNHVLTYVQIMFPSQYAFLSTVCKQCGASWLQAEVPQLKGVDRPFRHVDCTEGSLSSNSASIKRFCRTRDMLHAQLVHLQAWNGVSMSRRALIFVPKYKYGHALNPKTLKFRLETKGCNLAEMTVWSLIWHADAKTEK